MRLFISINIPTAIAPYCRKFQSQFPGMKNVNEFHLTLQFLGGDILEDRVPLIIEKLKAVSFKSFQIKLGDAVPFGNLKLPRGIWIECFGSAPLYDLAAKIRNAMGNLGYLPDTPFAAHVTLGRYKNGPPHVPKPVAGEFLVFTVDQFHLMQSQLGPDGSKYKILFSFTNKSKTIATAVNPSAK